MKKFVCILMVLLMLCASLVACNNTPATENSSGIMSRHCFICGYGEVDTIPKIEKTQSNNADPMLITIAISTPTVLIAAGAIILIIIIKKKA